MKKSKKSTEWREFEQAVASFLRALSPTAKVVHDIRLPDKDTGHLRQRDVWIEDKLLGHFPIKMLVSCKRYSKKIDEQDMDAFVGEILSAGANKGVIYSYSGFTTPAIEKAQQRGICCCTLYSQRPPDIPEVLSFNSYCCVSKQGIRVLKIESVELEGQTYDALFALDMGDNKKLIDSIQEVLHKQEQESVDSARPGHDFPDEWCLKMTITVAGTVPGRVELELRGGWNYYRGKLEAHLIDGSYSFTSKEFIGTKAIPNIEMWGHPPGEGWEPLEFKPDVSKGHSIIAILYKGGVKEALIEHFKGMRIEVAEA